MLPRLSYPNQAVFGHGISHLETAIFGEGAAFRGCRRIAPFIQAPKREELAASEMQKAMHAQRVRRMLTRNDRDARCRVRVGDCAAFDRPRGGKDGKEIEARWFGPAEGTHMRRDTSFHPFPSVAPYRGMSS